jgi:hypothetical protein
MNQVFQDLKSGARARQSLRRKVRQKPELLKRGLAELRDRKLLA